MRKLLGAGAVVVVVLLGVFLANFRFDWSPSLNPFREETTDNTGPSVLRSIKDLSEYTAASGYYETVVDLENDTSFVPSFLKGEKVLYVGKGTVDAVIDFGGLDKDRVTVSPDRTSVTIELPAPRIDEPNLDVEGSYVADSDRGLLDSFSDSDLEREAQLKAISQMTIAANGEADLAGRAEANTTDMLRGLLGALGYDDITVTFDDDPR